MGLPGRGGGLASGEQGEREEIECTFDHATRLVVIETVSREASVAKSISSFRCYTIRYTVSDSAGTWG